MITLAVPYLSAMAPARGWNKPQKRFCKASEKAKISRPYPNDSETGFKNRPSEDLNPKFIAKSALAAIIAKLNNFLYWLILYFAQQIASV